MTKPTMCIGKNKDADQLQVKRESVQRLCFRYMDSTIPLLSKSEIFRLQPSSVTAQAGLCRSWLKPRRPVFSLCGSFVTIENKEAVLWKMYIYLYV